MNSKCNPSTPFSLELPDSQNMINASWSARLSSGLNQSAGSTPATITCCSVAFLHMIVVEFWILHSAAFNVQTDDHRRLEITEITQCPIFVVPASFMFLLNTSDYRILSGDQLVIQSLLNNITDATIHGFKQILSAHDGSVFAISPTGMEAAPNSVFSHVFGHISDLSQVRIEIRGLVFAFNSTAPVSFDQWADLTINYFRSQATSTVYRDLVSHATFSVCSCTLLMLRNF